MFSGHALANVLAATDARLENTSPSAGAVDCPSNNYSRGVSQHSNNQMIPLPACHGKNQTFAEMQNPNIEIKKRDISILGFVVIECVKTFYKDYQIRI